MNKKDDGQGKDGKSFSDSRELFDTIFRAAKIAEEIGTEGVVRRDREKGPPEGIGEPPQLPSERDEGPKAADSGAEKRAPSDSQEIFEVLFREAAARDKGGGGETLPPTPVPKAPAGPVTGERKRVPSTPGEKTREAASRAPSPRSGPPAAPTPVPGPSGEGGKDMDRPVTGEPRPPGTSRREGVHAGDGGKDMVAATKGPEIPAPGHGSTKRKSLVLGLLLILLLVLAGAALRILGFMDFDTPDGGPAKTAESGEGQVVKEKVLLRPAAKIAPEEAPAPRPQALVPPDNRTQSGTASGKEQEVPGGGEGTPPEGREAAAILTGEAAVEKAPETPAAGIADSGERAAPAPEASPQYPYSVYLGSFSRRELVEKAAAAYERKGLSPYWFSIDLGEKGVWYRVYAGYFKTRGDADAFIKGRDIPEAAPRNTRFALLIGTFDSGSEMEKRLSALKELGCGAYGIEDDGGRFRLYAGAFYQRDQAEKLIADLALGGVEGRVVER